MFYFCIFKFSVVFGKSRCLINVCIIEEWMYGWMYEWSNSNIIKRLNLRKIMRCSKKEIIIEFYVKFDMSLEVEVILFEWVRMLGKFI